MPLAIVAGLPRFTVVKLHADYVYQPPAGWQFTWVHAEHTQPDLEKCWQALTAQLCAVENSSNHEGAHVLAFHKTDQTRKKIVERIEPHHRLRFLNTKLLGLFGTADFTEHLDKALEEETFWRREIHPEHHSHPLVLPEEYFTPIDTLSGLWRQARTANSTRDVNSVAQMLIGFRRIHKDAATKPNCFEDDAGLRFKYNVEPHGEPNRVRDNWKYSFRLPDKMQYDVELTDGTGPFTLRGMSFKTHANISPQGAIIGGP